MADPSKPRASLAPWDRQELPGRFTVEETATRVGNYKWIEMRIFELMGGWVATIPELDVKFRLGTHYYHHAFHSELWHKRLPELKEMNPERLTKAPNAELEAFVARARSATDLPLAVGFGIGTPEQAARVARIADGVIVGSALIKTIGASERLVELWRSLDADSAGKDSRILR